MQLGKIDISDISERGQITLKADIVTTHHAYDYDIGEADVALVRMTQPVSYGYFIQPVCLVKGDQNVVDFTQDKHCFSLGYGNRGDTPGSKMQKLPVTATRDEACRRQGINAAIGHVCIVAESTNQASPCNVSIDYGPV